MMIQEIAVILAEIGWFYQKTTNKQNWKLSKLKLLIIT